MIPIGNGGDSNRSVVRLQPILQHQQFNLAMPWPLIGSVNEASLCRVLFKRAGITDPGFGVIKGSACLTIQSVLRGVTHRELS